MNKEFATRWLFAFKGQVYGQSLLILCIVIPLIFLPSKLVHADMSVRAYQKNISNPAKRDFTIFYIEAVGTGITWTSNAYGAWTGKSVICMPARYKLTGERAASLLVSFFRSNQSRKIKPKDSISMALLGALTFKFPCKG
jgi:hypothetical protein